MRVVIRMLAPLHYRSIAARSHEHPVLFTTDGYNMENVARQIKPMIGGVPLVIREWPRSNFLLSRFRKTPQSIFQHEVWLEMWNALAQEDGRSRMVLAAWLDRVGETIEKSGDVFSYKDVSFADIIAAKFRGGIAPFILQLHRKAAGLRLLLDTVKPRAVISVGDREYDMFLGEMCREMSIPAVMISHGSHVPPTDQVARHEWGEQAQRMICAGFPCTALQSPLAEEFVRRVPASATPLRTGPIVWGRPVDRSKREFLHQALVHSSAVRYVIVHAGTLKWRGSVRFHVYETPDEYVQSVCDLAKAVERLDDTHLVIKFRPSPGLSAEDLLAALPYSERVSLSIDEPFLEVLGIANLLVSFSSTTIEEALQNNVPVLLYGGNGRYQHITATEVTAGKACGHAAVYFVRSAADLPAGLRQILTIHGNGKDPALLFETYKFRQSDCMTLCDGLKMNGRQDIPHATSV